MMAAAGGHAARAHALLSASGAHRWMICTPSARLEEQFPDTAPEAAREGTLAHELAEAKVRNYFYPEELSKRQLTAAIKKFKKNELWQDEMLEHTDTYLDYIKGKALAFHARPTVRIEQRIDLGEYIQQGFGTADCVMICGNEMIVVDFKYGKGVPVSSENNPQLMLYALGAMKSFELFFRPEKVTLTIVQPRLDSVSEWELSRDDLVAFGETVKVKAAEAYEGKGEFVPGESQCRFCRARAKCRARAEESVKLAFSPDMGKLPPLITDVECGKYLEQAAGLERWVSDLKDYALSACLAGQEIPGWKAVEGRGSRAWTDMDAAFDTLTGAGIAEDMLFERKPLTLAQVEKVVGKKQFGELVGGFVAKSPGKPALVAESDKRPAITNKVTAAEAFADNE